MCIRDRCIFQWIDTLANRSPLERLGVASTFQPLNFKHHVKTEPGGPEARPSKRKRENPSPPSCTFVHELPVLAPLKRYEFDLSQVQSAIMELEHVKQGRVCSWWRMVTIATEMLVEVLGDSPTGQIVVVSDEAPNLDGVTLNRIKLPLGVRLHQFTFLRPTELMKQCQVLSALHQFTLRQFGTSTQVSEVEALLHAMEEMQIECLLPQNSMLALGHLRTPIQVIPSVGRAILSAVGCSCPPRVFSIVGFVPLAEANLLPVISIHHTVLSLHDAESGDGAELYIGLQTILQRDKLAAWVRLSDDAFAICTSLSGSNSAGKRRCLVLSVVAPGARLPTKNLADSTRTAGCFKGTQVVMSVRAAMDTQSRDISEAVATDKKVVAAVKKAVPLAASLAMPTRLDDIKGLVQGSEEAVKLLNSAQAAMQEKLTSRSQ
eukprot:TRINITY_DN22061_c0_g1_i2.p1 TRINITY_DN22061_c0_g1~~TRINITY_DN22061_c0_g1_i2.p1  ORF type:complete len:433 (-),score=115.89 TRINITY_DN22061_c0_g1_i2:246-1544(-)